MKPHPFASLPRAYPHMILNPRPSLLLTDLSVYRMRLHVYVCVNGEGLGPRLDFIGVRDMQMPSIESLGSGLANSPHTQLPPNTDNMTNCHLT